MIVRQVLIACALVLGLLGISITDGHAAGYVAAPMPVFRPAPVYIPPPVIRPMIIPSRPVMIPIKPGVQAAPRVNKTAPTTIFIPNTAPAAAGKATANAAPKNCTNKQPSCTSARRFCRQTCTQRSGGEVCFNDCQTAHGNCMTTGQWQSTGCNRTGLLVR
jgi:hypothetical protein